MQNSINLAEAHAAVRALMDEFGLSHQTSFIHLQVAKYDGIRAIEIEYRLSVFTGSGHDELEQATCADWRDALLIIRGKLNDKFNRVGPAPLSDVILPSGAADSAGD